VFASQAVASRAWGVVSAWSFTLHCIEAARVAPALIALRQWSKTRKAPAVKRQAEKNWGAEA
jgi:hypothetical protein